MLFESYLGQFMCLPFTQPCGIDDLAKYVYSFHRVTPELKYITANWHLNNGGEG